MKKLLLSAFALVTMAAQAQTTPEWTQQNSTLQAGAYPRVMHAVTADVVWAFAADGSGGGANLQLYTRTSNGGATWTSGNINLGNTALQISDLTGGDANTAWVAVNGAQQGIWKTSDGGATWAKQTTALYNLATSFPNTIYFWDVNNGVTMGDPDSSGKMEIYTTTNGGTNWTRIPGANQPTQTSPEYGYTTIKAVAGDTVWFGTDKGRVYKSNNRGLNWTVSQTPIADFGGVTIAGASGVLTLKDANTAWVMDQDGILYMTSDAGVTWEPLSPVGTVYTSDLTFVPGTANTLISAAASASGRGSSISYDGGLNWTDIIPAAGDADGIPSLAAFSSTAVYGGGFSTSPTEGGMNKLSSLMAATINPALAASAVTVYPNPTKGQVNFESKSEIKSIEISDASGRLVKTFGSLKQIDLSTVKTGVYFLNITLKDGSKSSTKLIKN